MTGFQKTTSGPVRARIGIGVVLLSSVLIAMAPNAAKIAYQEGANPLSAVVVRHVVGAILIAAYLSARAAWPKDGWATFLQSGGAGLAQVVAAFGLLGSVAFIDVSLAALIFYFHPFLVAVIEAMRGGFSLSRARFAYMLTATVGLGLALGVSFNSLDPTGIGLGLVGMVSAAIWILLGARVSRLVGPYPAGFYMTVWSILYLVALSVVGPKLGLLNEMQFPSSTVGWIAIVGAGATTTAGLVLFFVGAVIIGASRAALITLSEPIIAILLAIVLLQEWLTLLQWMGVLVVVISLVRFETSNR